MHGNLFRHAALAALGGILTCGYPARAQSASNDLYQAVIGREFGTAVAEMQAIEKLIHDAKPADYAAIEAGLLRVLEAPGATVPGRQFALRMLPFVATPKCIPAVARLLRDKDLAHMARSVLLNLPDKEAGAALAEALADTQGLTRIGIIHTLGDRRERPALKPLAKLLGQDDDTGRAVLNAIGKIGGAEAAEALDAYKPSEALKADWAMAYLRCAEGVGSEGDAKKAEKMCRMLIEGPYAGPVRVGAFQEVVRSQKEAAAPVIAQMLSSENSLMRGAALTAVLETPGAEMTAALVKQLGVIAPAAKATLIGQLAVRGEAEGVAAAAVKLVADADPAVREAAIKALGRVGDATSVEALAPLLKDDAQAEAARQALVQMPGKAVAEAIVRQADSKDAAVRAGVLGVLNERKESAALPAARKAATDADAKVREAALGLLSRLGTREDIQPLCESLLSVKGDAGRENLTRAIQAVSLRIEDKASRADPVIECYARADARSKALLLPVLAVLGGDKALGTVRAALGEKGDVRKAAVRALADWPDASPLEDLGKVAKEKSDAAVGILALRGYIKMIAMSGLGAEQKVQAYREALAAAERSEEKVQILAGLATLAHADGLKVIEPSLGDGGVKAEAFQAYETIAEAAIGSQPAAASNALQRVISEAADEALREKAKGALKKIK